MSTAKTEGRLHVVAAAFGTVVAMWAIGYVSHLPGVVLPGAVTLGSMLACLVAGGFLVGRHAGFDGLLPGAGRGVMVGVVVGVVNLLILGSVLTSADATGVVPSALVWVPGSLAVSAIMSGLGGALGTRVRGATWDNLTWRTGLALVATLACLLVVIAGGLVTSLDAGLAVPDWPNSFGSNMFLYPLAKMTGGIYYEHAHRLYGSLVGLTTIVLAVTIWRTDRRRWLIALAVLAIAMVVGQGIMGGLRVTGEITLAADGGAAAPPSRTLAIVHGVFGQVFLATIALIWAFTTRSWREAGTPRRSARAGTEHTLAVALLVTLVAQISLGAMYRHMVTAENPMPWPAMAHFTLSLIVAIFAYMLGLRMRAFYADRPALPKLGTALLILISLQLLLGVAALIPVMAQRAEWKTIEVILATAHQANGAIVLVIATQLVAWTKRLLAVDASGVADAPDAPDASIARV